MENSNSSTGKIISALLVGTAIGGVLGIFLAPHKGSRTYKNLLKGAKDLSDDMKDKVQEEVNVLRVKVEGLESLAQDKIRELTKSMKSKVNEDHLSIK